LRFGKLLEKIHLKDKEKTQRAQNFFAEVRIQIIPLRRPALFVEGEACGPGRVN
jgi:hypothetical protein